jgi:hypothetical protein
MGEEWLKLDVVGQAVYYLELCEQLRPILSGQAYSDYVWQALDECWQWVETRARLDGDDLYALAMQEETGIFFIQNQEQDAKRSAALNCILETVMQTAYAAYITAGERYLPQEYECASPLEMFSWTMRHFESALDNAKESGGRIR